jgi:hypothetical protein
MRILITNFWLKEFNDSETFCIEFIDHCTELGHTVELYALDVDSTMRTYCAEHRITLHDSNAKFASTHYDLIWMHHNVIPRDFLLNSNGSLTANVLISHHMSAFEPNDVPFFPQLESKMADRIFANSHDVKILLKELGLPDKKVEIIGSPAPKKFQGSESSFPQLNKFLFVANDPPKNMLAAVDMLETIGFEVKRIERSQFVGDRNWISPNDFMWADSIISIEETIPYAVLSQRPIYLYNKYSGLGWVTDDSELNSVYLREKKINLDSNTLGVSAIVDQLLSGYEDARSYINNLDQDSTKKFQLEPVLNEILDTLASALDSSVDCFDRLADQEKVSWLAIQDILIREVQARKHAEVAAKQALLERLIVVEKLKNVEKELEDSVEVPVTTVSSKSTPPPLMQKKFSLSGRSQK